MAPKSPRIMNPTVVSITFPPLRTGKFFEKDASTLYVCRVGSEAIHVLYAENGFYEFDMARNIVYKSHQISRN
jgi:hypothetical protein